MTAEIQTYLKSIQHDAQNQISSETQELLGQTHQEEADADNAEADNDGGIDDT